MDMWQEREQDLDPSWTKQWDGGRRREHKTKREFERERLYLLSKFLENRTNGFMRSKGKSSSSRQGLRIEIEVEEL